MKANEQRYSGRLNQTANEQRYSGRLNQTNINTPCPSAPVRCASVAFPVDNFAESPSPVIFEKIIDPH